MTRGKFTCQRTFYLENGCQVAVNIISNNPSTKMVLADGALFAQQRVASIDFVLSPTQPVTPTDGNCLLTPYDTSFTTMDKTVVALRHLIASSLNLMIFSKR